MMIKQRVGASVGDFAPASSLGTPVSPRLAVPGWSDYPITTRTGLGSAKRGASGRKPRRIHTSTIQIQESAARLTETTPFSTQLTHGAEYFKNIECVYHKIDSSPWLSSQKLSIRIKPTCLAGPCSYSTRHLMRQDDILGVVLFGAKSPYLYFGSHLGGCSRRDL